MANITPPCEVALTYRPVGAGHVFTAEGMPEFHIASSQLKRAFELAIKGIGEHVSELSGEKVAYHTELTFDEFKACVDGESLMANFLLARRDGTPADRGKVKDYA